MHTFAVLAAVLVPMGMSHAAHTAISIWLNMFMRCTSTDNMYIIC